MRMTPAVPYSLPSGPMPDRLIRGALVTVAVIGAAVFLYFLTADSRRQADYCHTHPLSTQDVCHPDPGEIDPQNP